MIYDPNAELMQAPEELLKYDKFYHKNGLVLQDRCGNVSDYLNFTQNYTVSLYDADACHVLNHPNNLTQLIRENEPHCSYVNEALLRPYTSLAKKRQPSSVVAMNWQLFLKMYMIS